MRKLSTLRTKEVFTMSTAVSFKMIDEARSAALSELRDEANLADLADDSKFPELLNKSQTVFEMSDDEVADIFMVSRPTINRWSNGKSLPHRRVRKAMFTWIADTASKRLRIVKKRRAAAVG